MSNSELAASISDNEKRLELEKIISIFPTPLTRTSFNPALGYWVKDETTTPSQSFKYRGAKYWFESNKDILSQKSITIASTGNHGISCALLAKDFGIKVNVFMPFAADVEKIKKIKLLDAHVHIHGESLSESLINAKKYSEVNNSIFLPSLERGIINGHASLFIEAKTQVPDLKYLFFPVGVGAGIAGQIRGRLWTNSNTKIIAVLHEANASWIHSLSSSLPISIAPKKSRALGLRVTTPDAWAFKWIKQNVDDIIIINDHDIIEVSEKLSLLDKNEDLTSYVSLSGASKYLSINTLDKNTALAVKC